VEDKEEKAEDDKSNEEKADEKDTLNKEQASTKNKKLGLGEAISLAVDQRIQAPVGLKEEIAQAWEGYYAEKHGIKKSE